jgi:hypothetical protein
MSDTAETTPSAATRRAARRPRRAKAQPDGTAPAPRGHATGRGYRVGGDHPALHWIVVVGTILTGIASFMISFTSLLAVAVWQRTPKEFHALTPVMVDLPVIVFSVATMIFKYREQVGAMWFARILSWFVTALSSGANFLHTASISGLATYEDWIGASFNGLAPIFVYCSTEILAALITRPKAKDTAVAKAKATLKAAQAELKAERAAHKKSATAFAAEIQAMSDEVARQHRVFTERAVR